MFAIASRLALCVPSRLAICSSTARLTLRSLACWSAARPLRAACRRASSDQLDEPCLERWGPGAEERSSRASKLHKRLHTQLHKRLHTHRARLKLQVVLSDEPGDLQQLCRSPLTDSNRRPPPYHGDLALRG